jgi:hypothetical protein
MFVHFGNHYYGKVDVVPDVCYVATRFFHVNFVPLIPLGSCIIVAGSENGNFQGVKTALSLKSILTAWFRAWLYVVVVGCLGAGGLLMLEHFNARGTPLSFALGFGMVGMVAAATLWMTYRFSRASYKRALQLGAELGLEPDFIERYLARAAETQPEPAREPEGWERYS